MPKPKASLNVQPAKTADDFSGKTRTITFRVVKMSEESDRRFMVLSEAIQRLKNLWLQKWLALHVDRGNERVVKAWMDADRKWAETKAAFEVAERAKLDASPSGARGSADQRNAKARQAAEKQLKAAGLWPRAKCPVTFTDSAMAKELYDYVRMACPTLNCRPVVLAINKLANTASQAGASNSAYKRWLRILAGYGEFPTFSSPQPIPFDADRYPPVQDGKARSGNARLIPPDHDKGDWAIRLTIERTDGGEEDGKSVVDLLTLQTKGRSMRSQTAVLWKLAAGEWWFCGSELVCKRGRWEVHITYRQDRPEHVACNPDKTAYLWPGKRCSWLLQADGKTSRIWIPGEKLLDHKRASLLVGRWSRQACYRLAGSSLKGHGQRHVTGKLERLRFAWKHFVKSCNDTLVAEVLRRMERCGAGRVVYFQPDDARREQRFLAEVGKDDQRRDGTLWDWHYVAATLARKCEESGRKCDTKKWGSRERTRRPAVVACERSGGVKTLGTARRPQRVASVVVG